LTHTFSSRSTVILLIVFFIWLLLFVSLVLWDWISHKLLIRLFIPFSELLNIVIAIYSLFGELLELIKCYTLNVLFLILYSAIYYFYINYVPWYGFYKNLFHVSFIDKCLYDWTPKWKIPKYSTSECTLT